MEIQNAIMVLQAPQNNVDVVAPNIVGFANAVLGAIQHNEAAAAAGVIAANAAMAQVEPVPQPVLRAIELIRRYWATVPFVRDSTVQQMLERVPHDRLLAIRAAMFSVRNSWNNRRLTKRDYREAVEAHDAEQRQWYKSRLATRMRIARGRYVRACDQLREDETHFGVTTLKHELRDRLNNTVEEYAALVVAGAQYAADLDAERRRIHADRDITNERVGGYTNTARDSDHWTVIENP